MIEEIVRDYLNENSSIPWYLEVPTNPPGKFGVIQKTGGTFRNRIHRATIALQSYGETLYEAASLNEETVDLMLNIVSLDSVCASALNSDYNYTNPNNKKYRYQAVFDLVYYGG